MLLGIVKHSCGNFRCLETVISYNLTDDTGGVRSAQVVKWEGQVKERLAQRAPKPATRNQTPQPETRNQKQEPLALPAACLDPDQLEAGAQVVQWEGQVKEGLITPTVGS